MAMMMASRGADRDLGRYLTEIRKYPLLSAEDEYALAVRWRESRDEAAGRLLAGSHLRLVVKIAKGFRGYGLPLDDLIAEGNVGLMQALEKFDPERGFRLVTYAVWWIRAMIQEYILHNWSLVKMGTTAAQKKLFFNLRTLKARMRALEEGDLSIETVEAIAEELGLAPEEVVDMNRRLGRDFSLNALLRDDEAGREWQDTLADTRPSQEALLTEASELAWRRRLLMNGLDRLSARERHILIERRLKDNPLTLEELSHRYEVSRERVRQIEARALEKLEQSVRALARRERRAAHLGSLPH